VPFKRFAEVVSLIIFFAKAPVGPSIDDKAIDPNPKEAFFKKPLRVSANFKCFV